MSQARPFAEMGKPVVLTQLAAEEREREDLLGARSLKVDVWSVARPADTRPLGRLITTHPTGSSRVGRIGLRSGTLVGLGWLHRPRGPENSLVIDHVAWPPFGYSERAHRRSGSIRGGARVDHAAAGKWGVAFRLEPTALLHNEVASVRPQAKYASGQVLGQVLRVEVGQASLTAPGSSR